MKTDILGMHQLPFQSLQNISIFFTMLHNIKCLVTLKCIKVYEKIFLLTYEIMKYKVDRFDAPGIFKSGVQC